MHVSDHVSYASSENPPRPPPRPPGAVSKQGRRWLIRRAPTTAADDIPLRSTCPLTGKVGCGATVKSGETYHVLSTSSTTLRRFPCRKWPAMAHTDETACWRTSEMAGRGHRAIFAQGLVRPCDFVRRSGFFSGNTDHSRDVSATISVRHECCFLGHMQADSQLPTHCANGTAADLASTARLILSADKPFYFSSRIEVTHVVDRLTDLAVDVGFGTRLRCRGELNPHSLGSRARGLDCQRSSGPQSGLARLDKPIRVAHMMAIRNQSLLAALPGLSQTS